MAKYLLLERYHQEKDPAAKLGCSRSDSATWQCRRWSCPLQHVCATLSLTFCRVLKLADRIHKKNIIFLRILTRFLKMWAIFQGFAVLPYGIHGILVFLIGIGSHTYTYLNTKHIGQSQAWRMRKFIEKNPGEMLISAIFCIFDFTFNWNITSANELRKSHKIKIFFFNGL